MAGSSGRDLRTKMCGLEPTLFYLHPSAPLDNLIYKLGPRSRSLRAPLFDLIPPPNSKVSPRPISKISRDSILFATYRNHFHVFPFRRNNFSISSSGEYSETRYQNNLVLF